MKDSLYLNNLASTYCNKLSKIPEVLVVFICDEELQVFIYFLFTIQNFFFQNIIVMNENFVIYTLDKNVSQLLINLINLSQTLLLMSQ